MSQQYFNINPRRISELIQQVMDELKADGEMIDAIRKEKAMLIGDIFRGLKLAQIHDKNARIAYQDQVNTFDKLYELDLNVLEAYSKAIDSMNTNYMRQQVRKNNLSAFGDIDYNIKG